MYNIVKHTTTIHVYVVYMYMHINNDNLVGTKM